MDLVPGPPRVRVDVTAVHRRSGSVDVIDSFEAGTIKVKTADAATFGMRFYDGVDAPAKGRYLTQDFGATR
jgi:hypothetical protein